MKEREERNEFEIKIETKKKKKKISLSFFFWDKSNRRFAFYTINFGMELYGMIYSRCEVCSKVRTRCILVRPLDFFAKESW